MKHLAAYLLLGLAGNSSPSAADISTVLESVGIEADKERLTSLLGELEGKDINEVRHAHHLTSMGLRFETDMLHSLSHKAPRSSPRSHLVALEVRPRLLAALPVVLPLKRLPRRLPRKRRRRSPTTTWASGCSIKRVTTTLQRQEITVNREGCRSYGLKRAMLAAAKASSV